MKSTLIISITYKTLFIIMIIISIFELRVPHVNLLIIVLMIIIYNDLRICNNRFALLLLCFAYLYLSKLNIFLMNHIEENKSYDYIVVII